MGYTANVYGILNVFFQTIILISCDDATPSSNEHSIIFLGRKKKLYTFGECNCEWNFAPFFTLVHRYMYLFLVQSYHFLNVIGSLEL